MQQKRPKAAKNKYFFLKNSKDKIKHQQQQLKTNKQNPRQMVKAKPNKQTKKTTNTHTYKRNNHKNRESKKQENNQTNERTPK